MTKFIIALVGLVAAGALFFLYTKPAYDGTQIVQNDINQYNAALDKAAELQKLKQTLLSKYNAFNPTDIDRLQKLLPDHIDNVRLILDLDNLAGKYGLALQNVDVSNEVTGGNKTPLGAIGASNQKYEMRTLKFATHSTYPVFLQFLTDLEQSLRIVDLASLSLSADTAPVGGQPSYAFDISLKTYWLK